MNAKIVNRPIMIAVTACAEDCVPIVRPSELVKTARTDASGGDVELDIADRAPVEADAEGAGETAVAERVLGMTALEEKDETAPVVSFCGRAYDEVALMRCN